MELITIRPRPGERHSLAACQLSPEGGTEGDRWADDCWLKLPNNRPHPDVQICIMNARMIQLIAADRSRWSLAGDNLFVDLDLSCANLAVGQRLRVGECLIEITEQAHQGCGKFRERFGPAALGVVNSPWGKEWRLRGIYARVILAGTVRVGDRIRKIAEGAPSDYLRATSIIDFGVEVRAATGDSRRS